MWTVNLQEYVEKRDTLSSLHDDEVEESRSDDEMLRVRSTLSSLRNASLEAWRWRVLTTESLVHE